MTPRARRPAPLLAVLAAAGCGGDPSVATGVDAGGPIGPEGGEAPTAVDCRHGGSGTDYRVGPDHELAELGEVPFESLGPGDTVRVFWRAEPYRSKLMIGGVGTAEQPIRVCGVPGPSGELPVIDGDGATTRPQLDFPFDGHQVRGLVTIGHPNQAPYERQPAYIRFEGFEVRNASQPYTFSNRDGQTVPYARNAAGIFVQRGHEIVIRGCTVTLNGNGMFIGTSGGIELTTNVLIEGNHIHANGNPDGFSEHNVYNEASNVVYQYNRFGPTRAGQGAGIKERSAGVLIRYNWIEGGAHLIDLVDAQEAKATTVPMASFHESYVYGNVLVRRGYSGSMIHYGGDSGILADYRKGTLHFFHNTVVIDNQGNRDYQEQDVFELSTNDEHLDARNNIFFSTAPSTEIRPIVLLGRRDQITSGVAELADNFVTPGWFPVDPTVGQGGRIDAEVDGFDDRVEAPTPGFVDAAGDDFHLTADAPARAAGQDLSGDAAPGGRPARYQYVLHQDGKPRDDGVPPALGALAD